MDISVKAAARMAAFKDLESDFFNMIRPYADCVKNSRACFAMINSL